MLTNVKNMIAATAIEELPEILKINHEELIREGEFRVTTEDYILDVSLDTCTYFEPDDFDCYKFELNGKIFRDELELAEYIRLNKNHEEDSSYTYDRKLHIKGLYEDKIYDIKIQLFKFLIETM